MGKGMTPEKGRDLAKYEAGYDKAFCREPSVGTESHKLSHVGSTPTPASTLKEDLKSKRGL